MLHAPCLEHLALERFWNNEFRFSCARARNQGEAAFARGASKPGFKTGGAARVAPLYRKPQIDPGFPVGTG
jgi:hypothetical protein